MKMADTDATNVEVMEDVDIMLEHDNSVPGVNVQKEADSGKNVLQESAVMMMNGKLRLTTVVLIRKEMMISKVWCCLCLERKECIRQNAELPNQVSKNNLKIKKKKTVNISCK
jgi:hypothetical protein